MGIMLGRIVSLIASLIAALIVLGIILIVLEANPSNDVVSAINDAAEFFVGPFKDIFSLDDRKLEVAINWGIAAAVYVIVGRIIAALLAGLGAVGGAEGGRRRGFMRRRRRGVV